MRWHSNNCANVWYNGIIASTHSHFLPSNIHKNSMKIAIIGFGSIGKRHYKNITTKFILVDEYSAIALAMI